MPIIEGVPFCGVTEKAVEGVSLPKWKHAPAEPVTYAFRTFIAAIGEANQRTLTAGACMFWSKHSGIRFKEITDQAGCNILIGAARGPRWNFDGKSGTLAWAEIPSGIRQVRLMYDLDEAWSDLMLLLATAHEIGHAIGIYHEEGVPTVNLMEPRLNMRLTDLGPWDIDQAVTRYGLPSPILPPTPPVPPTPPGPGAFGGRVLIEIGGAKMLDTTF